jgi:hypothetical protein
MRYRICIFVVLASCQPGTSALQSRQEALEADSRSPAYVDISDYLAGSPDQERLFGLIQRLRRNFDEVCGDSFCEGEYTHLEPMALRCPVSVASGRIKECVYSIAANRESIHQRSGVIHAQQKFFHCPLAVTATPRQLLDALMDPAATAPPLERRLPDGGHTINDALRACLPPWAADSEARRAAAYSDMQDYVQRAGDEQRLQTLVTQLRQDFGEESFDSFCQGQYPNLDALDLRCSVSNHTGQIAECIYVLAGSYETVRPRDGAIHPDEKFVDCRLPVTSTPKQLLDALLDPAVSSANALHRPLPGTTQSISDTLVACCP